MEDVNISKFRAQVVRAGSTPASPGFVVSEGQNPVDPSGSGQNHLPVTIATAATGLSITESQVLGGAGTVGQYIRGDGSLADFPATTGGGSSVSYYLNGSVSQGTIGGVAYKELNRTPIFGAGTDITTSSNGYIANFITDAGDPNKLLIPAGNWNLETYFSANSGGGSPTFYVELYKYNGTTFTLIATSSATPELIAFGTNINPYFSTLAVPETVLALTDRLALRYYVNTSGRTITLHTEDNHLCQVITTFTTGLTALNGLTNQVQFFAVGTSGTDFAISSATDTHTFNLPTASATNRGALSSADWTTFNNKTSNLGTVTSVGLSSATSGVTIGSTPITTSGTITLAIATASGSQNGLLSSTDWTTFNGKQNALTNPVTGTGTTNYLPKFTGASAIGNSIVQDVSTRIDVAGGLRLTPSSTVDIQAYTGSAYSNLFYDAASHNWQTSGGTAKMVLVANGNLLVGTTTDSGFKLDVNGTGRFNGNIFLSPDGTYGSSYITLGLGGTSNGSNRIFAGTSSSVDGIFIAAATGRPISFRAGGGTTDHLVIASTGAATFSSSVTANGPITMAYAGNPRLILQDTDAGAGNVGILFKESTNDKWALASVGGNFQFFNEVTSSNAIFITSGNNVLIGTTTDNGARLQVSGTSTFSGQITVSTNNGIVVGANGRAFIREKTGGDAEIGAPTGGQLFLLANNTLAVSFNGAAATFSSSVTANGLLDLNSNSAITSVNDKFAFGVNGTSYAWIQSFGGRPLILQGVGNEVIVGGTADNGAYNLQCNGTGVWGAGAYVNGSDRNIKDNISTIEKGLEYIEKMNPVRFKYKPNYTRDHTMQTGFIAQELQEVFANEDYLSGLVQNGVHLSVAYQNLLPILVKAIQEQQVIINDLKQKIS
jgi:hypothetical protein